MLGVIACSTPCASSCDSCHGIFSRSVSSRSASAWRRTMFSATWRPSAVNRISLRGPCCDQAVALHALQRGGDRRRRDVEALGQPRGDDRDSHRASGSAGPAGSPRRPRSSPLRPSLAGRVFTRASIEPGASIPSSALQIVTRGCASRVSGAAGWPGRAGGRLRAAGRAARSRSSAASCSCRCRRGGSPGPARTRLSPGRRRAAARACRCARGSSAHTNRPPAGRV